MKLKEILKYQRHHKLELKYLKEAYRIANKRTKIKAGKRHIVALIDHYAGRPER